MNVAGQLGAAHPRFGWDPTPAQAGKSRAIESAVTSPGRNRRWLEGDGQLPFGRRSVILKVGTAFGVPHDLDRLSLTCSPAITSPEVDSREGYWQALHWCYATWLAAATNWALQCYYIRHLMGIGLTIAGILPDSVAGNNFAICQD